MRVAPPYTPRMPKSGRPLSVRMTNCGPLGWMTDAAGYRYQARHPETGAPWPPIPDILLAAWRELADYPHPPEACLVNVYGPAARMGLHQDRDEEDMTAPVVSLSLGDSCLFRIGGDEAATIRPARCAWPRATPWCWAAARGSPFTASTASSPAARRCCRKAAGSI